MSHYDKGVRFERKTRKDLVTNGYTVIRAAGSKGDSKIDLIAFKPGQELHIQCKESGDLGPAEWDRIVEVAGWVGAIPLLAANGPRGRGVVYTELLGPKVPRARTQPCRPFLLDEIAAADPQACTTPGHPGFGGWCQVCHWDGTPEPAPVVTGRDPLALLVDADGNLPDSCGRCVFLPTVNGWVRAVQTGCPAHGDLPAPVVVPYQAGRRDDVHDIPLPTEVA